MNNFELNLSESVLKFFQKNLDALTNYHKINVMIKEISGINNFFTSQNDSNDLLNKLKVRRFNPSDIDRREYGDFQTNKKLAFEVAKLALSKFNDFEFILEPTCGKGNFIIETIKQLRELKKVVGVEIYQPYIWETKFKILTFFIENNYIIKPDIDIIHANAFEFSYDKLAKSTKHLKTLIIGNPPWVTNSELSTINSKNLPRKSNFKNHNGLEAITGKGNFDIGENIALLMLRNFQNHNGIFAFLIKNTVVKNIIHDQFHNKYRFGNSEKLNINSKMEFGVSVNACLFLTQLNKKPDFICRELDFYTKKHLTTFGWYNDKFVYSVDSYDKSSIIDNQSVFTWRSGVKHDCSKVMELEKVNGHFINALGEDFILENDLIYGLLKSSDLKVNETNKYRKLTIITQKKIGQDTKYIKIKYPLTYKYLRMHKKYFDKRKSTIYKDKPDFSIFGIGNYSFEKYKIAISGLYKTTHFTLVDTKDSKPIMLDDTCYFIGFESIEMAQIAHYVLNSKLVQEFLKSIIFSDSKRPINKDILMRIDLEKAFEQLDFEKAKNSIKNINFKHWEEFRLLIQSHSDNQLDFIDVLNRHNIQLHSRL